MPGLTLGFLLLMGSCELLGNESLASAAASDDRLPASLGRPPPGFESAEAMDSARDVGLVKYRLVLEKVMVNKPSRV
jgi:hypothetical protein